MQTNCRRAAYQSAQLLNTKAFDSARGAPWASKMQRLPSQGSAARTVESWYWSKWVRAAAPACVGMQARSCDL